VRVPIVILRQWCSGNQKKGTVRGQEKRAEAHKRDVRLHPELVLNWRGKSPKLIPDKRDHVVGFLVGGGGGNRSRKLDLSELLRCLLKKSALPKG